MKRDIELANFNRAALIQAVSHSMRSGGWCRVNHTDDHLPSGVKEIKGGYYVASFALIEPEDPSSQPLLRVEITDSNNNGKNENAVKLADALIKSLGSTLAKSTDKDASKSPTRLFNFGWRFGLSN